MNDPRLNLPHTTLGSEDVVIIHDAVLQSTGGISGHNEEVLGGILSRIESRIFYDNLTDPIEIAAWYGFAIARGHAFADGNKRTALTCMDACLILMSVNINLTPVPEDLVRLMEEVAAGSVTHQALAEWLRQRQNQAN